MIRLMERLLRDLRCRRRVIEAASADNSRAKRRIDAAADSISAGALRAGVRAAEMETLVRCRRAAAGAGE